MAKLCMNEAGTVGARIMAGVRKLIGKLVVKKTGS
jgi:hypothetical protein